MSRVLVFAIIAYIVWKIVQSTMRIMHTPGSGERETRKNPEAVIPETPKFTDIQDAHFEEIPPEKGKEPPSGKASS
jgi:hypothetical protein